MDAITNNAIYLHTLVTSSMHPVATWIYSKMIFGTLCYKMESYDIILPEMKGVIQYMYFI